MRDYWHQERSTARDKEKLASEGMDPASRKLGPRPESVLALDKEYSTCIAFLVNLLEHAIRNACFPDHTRSTSTYLAKGNSERHGDETLLLISTAC